MSPILTIQMLVKNNEDTIEYTLESLMPLVHELNAEIIVGDLGCKDRTIEYCRTFGAKIVSLSLNDNLSKAKNHLIEKTDSKWIFCIEPYETILKGTECFESAIHLKPASYKATIIQGDVVTEQIRLWHRDMKLRYKNPVFETLSGPAQKSEICLVVANHDNSELQLELAKKWLDSNPLTIEPMYYLACAYLARKNWKAFLDYANMYLHQEKRPSMSAIMTRYYCSMVKCYIEKNYQEAIQHLLPCLAERPLMAEFWCLLGDVYYTINQSEKARCFYENAAILGSRRLRDDDWPLEISKYKEYPEKMIEACDKIKQSSRIYFGPGPGSDNSHPV